MDHKKIIIVGGGITGLTAAYYLQTEIKQNKLLYEIKVLEGSDTLGGKIQTMQHDGFTIERGADSFLGRKKPAVELIEQLGMSDQLVRNETGQAYILLHDELHAIPEGSFMGIPTQAKPFLSSDLFSAVGKARVGLDFVLPKSEPKADQSLGHFLRRRLGDECVDHLVAPLLSGVYSSDIDQMSLMTSFPNFYQLEQRHRSLIKGLRESMPQQSRSTGKRPGQFFALKNGFSSLITELAHQLATGTIELETSVNRIERDESGFIVQTKHGKTYRADAVMMATPHNTLPEIFAHSELFEPVKDIPMSSVANVALIFNEGEVEKGVQGTGFVVSRKSDFGITACTWTNEKWPHTTPDGKIMLRAYVGKPTDQTVVDLSDEEIIELVLADLKRVISIHAQPQFAVVTRYKKLMPQYTVGHQNRVNDVKEQIKKELPGLFIAGSSYEGVGVPDCIEQAKEVATEMVEHLMK